MRATVLPSTSFATPSAPKWWAWSYHRRSGGCSCVPLDGLARTSQFARYNNKQRGDPCRYRAAGTLAAAPNGAEVPAPSSRSRGQRATTRPNFVVAGIRMKHTYTERTVSRQGMALVQLAISPWGEVRVNGKAVGVSPPL